jgi:hypothetical protein
MKQVHNAESVLTQENDTPMAATPTAIACAAATELVPSSPQPEHQFIYRAFPQVPLSKLSKQFNIDMKNIDVTSLDIVPHGCYIFAGCSNGMILLFDMCSPDK